MKLTSRLNIVNMILAEILIARN